MTAHASRRPPQVVVVGAGISGLAAAYRLHRGGAEVLVLESAVRTGGALLVGEVAGVPVDLGAESLLARRPEALDLARAVGLGDELVHPEPASPRIWSRGRLRPLPRTVMGVPADPAGLAASGVLSRRGLLRARCEPLLPGRALDPALADEVSVGDLVDRRCGPEVTDRLLDPLLGGVYAGRARSLSLAAAAPPVAALATAQRSLVRAAGRSAASGTLQSGDGPARPVFAGLRGGLGRLPLAVTEALAAAGVEVRTSSTVRALRRAAGGGWRLTVGSAHDPAEIETDAVVLAVPAAPAARLLAEAVPSAAAELAGVEHASSVVVSLALRADGVSLPAGCSGFLVPAIDGRAIKGATFSGQKWSWVGGAAATDRLVVLRVSLGRHGEERTLQRTDDELVDLALADLAASTGLRSRPVDAVVTRWGGGIPQYAVGHLARVDRVMRAVAGVAGLEVCGATYQGVGVPACVADGQRAADRLLGSADAGAMMGS